MATITAFPPDIDGVLFLLRGCCQSIGLEFNKPADLQAFSIGKLVKQIEDAQPTDWNASLQMWVAYVKQQFAENPYFAPVVLVGFDVAWLNTNEKKVMGDLVAYLLAGHMVMI